MGKHIFIPDCQVTENSPTDHLRWIGNYIVEKKPDVIVHAGDFADMESLSFYDKGKRRIEGKRYSSDIRAANKAFKLLNQPLIDFNKKKKKNKERMYRPRKVITLGNHENRITRATEDDPVMYGTIGVDDLNYKKLGWEIVDYLDFITIDGITYSHFFYNQLSGRPYGGNSIETRLKNIGFSFVQGHQQQVLTGVRTLNNGTRIRGIVCGACYLHDEDYRGPQANAEWRGLFVLHEVENGDYNLMEVSLDFLCNRYEGVSLPEFMKKKHFDIYNNSHWMKKKNGERQCRS